MQEGYCTICTHEQRLEIERALLNIGETEFHTLERVAEAFNVDSLDLQQHALFHSPIAIDVALDNNTNEFTSIAKQLKMKEASMLSATAAEYMLTLQSVGRAIQAMATEDEFSFARKLTKPLVDLYIGAGSELRSTLKTLIELKVQLDGPKDDATTGISLLFNSLAKAMSRDQLG